MGNPSWNNGVHYGIDATKQDYENNKIPKIKKEERIKGGILGTVITLGVAAVIAIAKAIADSK